MVYVDVVNLVVASARAPVSARRWRRRHKVRARGRIVVLVVRVVMRRILTPAREGHVAFCFSH